MNKYFILAAFLFISLSEVCAQYPPREDDHFWRQRVQYTIDLEEKINKALAKGSIEDRNVYDLTRIRETKYDYGKGQYAYKKGLIAALVEAYKDQQNTGVKGYRVDSLHVEVTYNQFESKLNLLLGKDAAASGSSGSGSEGGESFEDGGLGGEEDGLGEEGGMESADVLPSSSESGSTSGGSDMTTAVFNMQKKLQIIEDRIFDKNKSDMNFDTKWILLYYVNPELQQDEAVVALKYDENLMTVLDQVMWKNRWNDAEYRSMKEIIELRLHNHYFVNVAGTPMYSLPEADDRKLRMVEFEHNLWEF